LPQIEHERDAHLDQRQNFANPEEQTGCGFDACWIEASEVDGRMRKAVRATHTDDASRMEARAEHVTRLFIDQLPRRRGEGCMFAT
jgi:hypothetical protein